jgi:hypothetical protein
MTVNGLPLHPLILHAFVVIVPVTALVALGFCIGRWRERLRWPLFGLALVTAALTWLTAQSGHDLLNSRFATATGELETLLQRHQHDAGILQPFAYTFAGIAVVATVFWPRLGVLKPALGILLAAAAIGTIVMTVITGDAGARAVWGS